jgi:DNA polymerase I
VRLLRTSFAERLARAFSPEDFGVVFADPDQLSLFVPLVEAIRTVLTPLGTGSEPVAADR